MKKIFTLSLLIINVFTFPFLAFSQDTLAGWSFPTGQAADTLANYHNSLNIDMPIHTAGGVSGPTTFTNGATTYAATATGWDNGMLTKYWEIKISTQWAYNLTLSSKQRSGGNNPGPRDFMVQYKIGQNGTWTDVTGTNITTAGDWSAELANVPLPADCENQTEAVYLRWIMTSDTNSLGNPVASTGISKIDDIFIKGDIITNISSTPTDKSICIYPNPTSNTLNISIPYQVNSLRLLNITGQEIKLPANTFNTNSLDISSLPNGIYILQFYSLNQCIATRKFSKTEAN